ncbi:MAG TPA: methyltransferase domain-containing protein [Bryobacteraceae bacterium]|jgi:SAM-dependent methyltransferase|nr:methyltransferase domain-containing protein [Bryobacteraceae bacterium]
MPTRIDDWNQRYRTGQQDFETPAPLVVQFTRDLTPGAALDLACGPGRNALYLAQRGWAVFAVDGSEVAIDLLHARARQQKLTVSADVADLEAGGIGAPVEGFDLVLSCYYLQRSLIPLMKAALRPGGLLIMIVNLAGGDQPQGTPTRAFPGELASFFEGWPILHYHEGDPDESGHRHAVAEFVTQKPAGMRC